MNQNYVLYCSPFSVFTLNSNLLEPFAGFRSNSAHISCRFQTFRDLSIKNISLLWFIILKNICFVLFKSINDRASDMHQLDRWQGPRRLLGLGHKELRRPCKNHNRRFPQGRRKVRKNTKVQCAEVCGQRLSLGTNPHRQWRKARKRRRKLYLHTRKLSSE